MASPDRAEALLKEIGDLYAIVLRIARNVHDADEPMTATQRLALIEIATNGPLRLSTLAQRMDTTPATATRAVDALEDLGFAARRRDPNDRRGVLVVPTSRGARWSNRRAALVRGVLERIPPEAAPARLVGDLERLNAALRSESGHKDIARGGLLAP